MFSPDPVEAYLEQSERRDHLWAKARGERVARLTRHVLVALDGHALLVDAERATPILYSAIADALYGNLSMDIPRKEPHD